MTGQTLALILTSVFLSASAQILLKSGVSGVHARLGPDGGSTATTIMVSLASPGVIGGLVLYGIGTLIWLGALARTELSQAYPFVGLGFVLTAVFGHLVFHETLSPARLLGTALIIGGIVLVART